MLFLSHSSSPILRSHRRWIPSPDILSFAPARNKESAERARVYVRLKGKESKSSSFLQRKRERERGSEKQLVLARDLMKFLLSGRGRDARGA